MGSDKSRGHYQGLIVEDNRITIWGDETTAGQAGPRPGVPTPLNLTGMTIQSQGSQSPDKDLRIRTQRGGFAEPDGAGFVWRNAGDPEWRGLDVPATITHYESLRWTDFSVPIKWSYQVDVKTLADHSIVCAYYDRDDADPLPFSVGIGVRTPAGVWSYRRVSESATQPTTSAEPNPCIVVLPSGRVLLYHWIEDLVRAEAQVRMWYSDDDGVTWALGEDNVLSTSVSLDPGAAGYEVRRLRAEYGAGQILLLCHIVSNNVALNQRDLIRQYASADEGSSFTVIEEFDGLTDAGGYPDLVYSGGQFTVAYIETQSLVTGIGRAVIRRVGNAFQPLTSTVKIDIFGPVFGTLPLGSQHLTAGDLAMTAAPDGSIYLTGRAVPNPYLMSYDEDGECFMHRSDDFGITWQPIGQFSGFNGLDGYPGVWYNSNTATTGPAGFAMTYSQGRIAVLHGQNANPGAIPGFPFEPSLSVSYLGGSSTVTLPGFQRFQTGLARVNFEDTWLPFDLPQVTSTQWGSGWTTAGGAAEVLESGRLRIGSGALGSRAYNTNVLPVGHTTEQGVIFAVSVATDQGGDQNLDQIAIRLQLDRAGGGFGWDLIIRLTPNEIAIVDGTPNAVVGVVPIQTTGAGIDILFGMQESQYSIWVRPRSGSPDRAWIAAPSSTLVNNGGGVGNNLSWGHLSASGSVSRWYSVQVVTGPYTGLQLAEGQINPNELMPHPYSASSTYVDDGLSIRATDGPTIRADEWQIATRYDFAVSNVLDPNPRQTWRSTDTTSQAIAWEVSATGNAAMQNDVIGLALYNINWPEALFQGRDATLGSWVNLARVFLTYGQSALQYRRFGNTVVPGAAGAQAPLMYAGEMEGALWSFGALSGHKISSHYTGKWDLPNTTKPLSLALDGITGAEPASGTGSISSRSGVWIIQLQGAKFSGFRLLLSAQGAFSPKMADDYFEIGRALIGPVVIHGDQTSWGRTIESSSGTELTEARDRTTRSRQVAPTRRIIDYGWTDAVDTTAGMNPAMDADPDFVVTSDAVSAEPTGLKDIAPWDFDGVFHLLAGADKQVVYVPRITHQNLTRDEPMIRRHQHALCRITSPVRLESVQGEESDTEVLRVASITLTEDV